jgi:hypothetical protein
MPKPNASRFQSFMDWLTTWLSAIQCRLVAWLSQLTEVSATFIGRSVDSLLALTGQVSEAVITSLTVSVASDVLRDFITKQWIGTPEEQEDIRQRTQIASEHLAQAAEILGDLQMALRERNQELERLLAEIEARQADAEHWRQIASVNEQLASALTREIEDRVRTQIRAELDRGKTRRLVFAVVSWVVTLILGGVVGVAIQYWWQTGKLFR